MKHFAKKAAVAVMALAMTVSSSAALTGGIVKDIPVLSASAASNYGSITIGGVMYKLYGNYAEAYRYSSGKEITILEEVGEPPIPVNKIVSKFADGQRNLKKVTIRANIPTIESKAFQNCTALEKIILPSTVNKIANNAFSGCTNLKSIRFPKTMTSIGTKAFKDCTALNTVVFVSDKTRGIKTSYFISGDAFANCTNLQFYTAPSRSDKPTDIYTKLTGSGYNVETFEYGDICDKNGNGSTGDKVIDNGDVKRVTKAVSKELAHADTGLTDLQYAKADVDIDGKITVSDALWLQHYVDYVAEMKKNHQNPEAFLDWMLAQ